MDVIATIYGGLFLACAAYARFLESLKNAYVPDWTWVTVVVGQSKVVMAMWLFCFAGAMPWSAFYLYAGAQIVAGLPIIAWQVSQTYRRYQRRVKRDDHIHERLLRMLHHDDRTTDA